MGRTKTAYVDDTQMQTQERHGLSQGKDMICTGSGDWININGIRTISECTSSVIGVATEPAK